MLTDRVRKDPKKFQAACAELKDAYERLPEADKKKIQGFGASVVEGGGTPLTLFQSTSWDAQKSKPNTGGGEPLTLFQSTRR